MKNKTLYLSVSKIFVAVFLVVFSEISFAAEKSNAGNSLFQVSTLQALISGDYDGSITLEDLLKRGNTGLGTFDKLDGEMIIWEGEAYKARIDGKIYRVNRKQKIPFANIAYIDNAEYKKASFSSGYDSLKEKLDNLFPAVNFPVVFLIKGEFTDLVYRSVPAQHKPYPPLTEVVKEQAIFRKDKINGILVGFRFPSYMKGINIHGYHLHFISADKKTGGHLFKVATGKLDIKGKYLDYLEVLLPDSFKSSNKDMSSDNTAVNKVEAQNK